jgi:hypothetical protein
MNNINDPAAVVADVQRLRERVRADRRTITAPVLVFGFLIVLHVAARAAVASAAGQAATHLTLLVYWPLAGAAGLLVLWNHAHRLAMREGVGDGPRSYRPITLGYVVSLPLIALLFIPALFIGVWASLVWPAVILAAVAVRQRSRVLKGVAQGLGVAGAVQGVLALLEAGTWPGATWAAAGLETAVGLGLTAGALVAAWRARET